MGTVVGAIVTSKTFWKVLAGILAAIVLFMFLVANMIGILLSYLGFVNADSFANEAQSAELASLRSRIEKILDEEEYKNELLSIIEQNRDIQMQEITADKAENLSLIHI